MIGIFDSGVGGLSVLREVRARMPHADIVYFGDTENAPYGERSSREIRTLIAMALRRLAAEGATDIVSACNSASVSVHTLPMDLLRIHRFTVIEMVEPTIKALLGETKKIVLLGTPATIRSGIYQQAFERNGMAVGTVAVPHLAGHIERGAPREELLLVVRSATEAAVERGAELISLACTHYPLIRELFAECLTETGSAATLFDPASAVAHEVAERFTQGEEGKLRFLVSRQSSVFESWVERLFPDERYSIEPAGSIYWALKAV